jgi:hypothetical protein
MADYVQALEVELQPSAGLQVDLSTQTFELEINDSRVVATPKAKMSFEDARERLAEELSPLLVVLGARRGIPEMTFREASWRLGDEIREDGTRLARIGLQGYVSMTADVIIAPPASYGDELAKKAEWVAADPV